MKFFEKKHAIVCAMAMVMLAGSTALAQDTFLDVGQQEPITIAINASPWLGGFQSVVDLYQQQTGNRVSLDVAAGADLLQKARNAVRSSQSPVDVLNLDTQWTIEFYEGDFLKPLAEIEQDFQLPEEVLSCGDSYHWNAEKRWRTSDGGTLMAIPPNCNTIVFVYRTDLLEQAGMDVPKTYDDLLSTCERIQNRPNNYGFVTPDERGNTIRFYWMPFMLGHGAEIVRDPEDGDYTVTINSPEAKEALDTFIEIDKRCGPPTAGSVGQTDMIQLFSADKAAMAQSVIAAWASLQDPTKSAVVGKVAAAVVPSSSGHPPAPPIGNWHLGVPRNVPEKRQEAALAFFRWFLTKEAQIAYAEAGGIPVRSDVLTELSEQPNYSWMAVYNDSMKVGHQVLGYAEGATVEEVIGLRLNQALIGEMSSAAALNTAAKEIHEIFKRSGRNTGMVEPLAE